MPRSRGSEMPQRQSPRGSLRTSSSDSDPPHQRPITDRSPKLGERRALRGTQPDSVNQKKLGTRIADLESQLGKAQHELKMLKDQLVSAKATKTEAQQESEKTSKKPVVLEPVETEEKHPSTECQGSNGTDRNPPDEVLAENQQETDVFEVQLEKLTVESKGEDSHQLTDQTGKEAKPIELSNEPPSIPQPEKLSFQDLAVKNVEINLLKTKLEEKEKELEMFGKENEDLKTQINLNISARIKEEEMNLKLTQLGQELNETKSDAAQLKEKLETAEGAKEELEAEMKKLRVQTEQWRKAADAAAAILSGGVETNGRITDRCGSMDKHFGGIFEPSAGGYTAFVGSPGNADDLDNGFGNGKRKGSGIRMFGDLWKKKSQK